MKVSGSILSVQKNFVEYAKILSATNADYLHVDIFQNDTLFKLDNILQFDGRYLPLDIHLIYEFVSDDDIKILNSGNTHYLNIQYENLLDKGQIKKLARNVHCKVGIAITKATDLSVVDEYIDDIAQILFMCSTPGVSGAQFEYVNMERIKEIHSHYPNLPIFADGGINNTIAAEMKQNGVSLVVSGSYLCKDLLNIHNSVYRLKYSNESNISIKRQMIDAKFLPICELQDSFMTIISTMNRYRLGCVFVVENGTFFGIITDGDIRRSFLKYQAKIMNQDASKLINVSPFTVTVDMTIENVYDRLYMLHKGIDIVPVLDNGCLVGALDLHIGI